MMQVSVVRDFKSGCLSLNGLEKPALGGFLGIMEKREILSYGDKRVRKEKIKRKVEPMARSGRDHLNGSLNACLNRVPTRPGPGRCVKVRHDWGIIVRKKGGRLRHGGGAIVGREGAGTLVQPSD